MVSAILRPRQSNYFLLLTTHFSKLSPKNKTYHKFNLLALLQKL